MPGIVEFLNCIEEDTHCPFPRVDKVKKILTRKYDIPSLKWRFGRITHINSMILFFQTYRLYAVGKGYTVNFLERFMNSFRQRVLAIG